MKPKELGAGSVTEILLRYCFVPYGLGQPLAAGITIESYLLRGRDMDLARLKARCTNDSDSNQET